MEETMFASAPDGSLGDFLRTEREKASRTVAKRREDMEAWAEMLKGAEAAERFMATEFTGERIRRAYDFGKMIRVDAGSRQIILSCAAVSEFAGDPEFDPVDDIRYGVLNGHIGRLSPDGQRFYAGGSIVADAESMDRIVDDFEGMLYECADEAFAADLRERAFRSGLSRSAVSEFQRRFYERGTSDAETFIDYSALRAQFKTDREAIRRLLASVFPELSEDGGWLSAARELQGFIAEIFGKHAKNVRYSNSVADRGIDPFYRVHGADVDKFRALAEGGNRAALVAGILACVKLNAGRASYRRKRQPELYDMAIEIADGGLSHPGQLVSLVKAYLGAHHGFGLVAEADEGMLYRGLRGLPAEILPGALRDADYFGGAFGPWLRDLCYISARAGEGPVRAAAWRFLAQFVRNARLDLYPYAGRADFGAIREGVLEFLTSFWRLLAREDKSGRKWADIRLDAKAIQEGLTLFLPGHEATTRCQCQLGRSLPASSEWAGMAASMRQASNRCYIERLENERLFAEAHGGVQKWAPARSDSSHFGDYIVREVADSAGLRALGGVLHNCLGGNAWAEDCKRGLLRIYAVHRIGEGAPGGCFALRMKEGRASVSETGIKGRGHTSITSLGVEAMAKAMALSLNQDAGFPCADAA